MVVAQSKWIHKEDSTSNFYRKSEHNNIIFVEGLGNGIGVSLNYERFINNYFSIRVGYGYTRSMNNIPVMFNFNLDKIHLEFGLGTVAYSGAYIGAPKNNHFLLTSSLGFKFIYKDLLFKATLSPYTSLRKDPNTNYDVVLYFDQPSL